jgi:hypothetical protein
MKKFIISMVALLAIVSAVVAVSAFEAHFVNVKAHVELALIVSPGELNFGTVFPEEWLKKDFSIALSPSFVGQARVNCVHYSMYATFKPIPDTALYYPWMGDFTYILVNADLTPGWDATTTGAYLIGSAPTPFPTGYKSADAGPGVNNTSSLYASPVTIGVGIDAPVFVGYYNPATDVKPKPSGLQGPTLVIQTNDLRWTGQSFDCGLDLIIQVTGMHYIDLGGNPW